MNIEDIKSLGEFVRQQRRQSGVTQKEVALAAGTGLRFIGELESGKPTCHIGKVFDVLRTLGMQVRIEKR
jgi:HTH-type transcriptional regulator/antitoxin HipB